MRQILSTALVALIVGALAGVSASSLAQPPAEAERVTTPTGFNADKVDGKHAVRATKMLRLRAKKLVATDRTGFLPDNIVQPLWHLIKNKPAVLADGQVGWDEVIGRPATPTVRLITRTQGWSYGSAPTLGTKVITVDCAEGEKVVGGGFYDINAWDNNHVMSSYPDTASSWKVMFDLNSGLDSGTAYAICMSIEGVTLAGRLTPAAKNPTGNR